MTESFIHSFSLHIYFQNCHIIMTYNIGKGECWSNTTYKSIPFQQLSDKWDIVTNYNHIITTLVGPYQAICHALHM